MVKWKCEPCGHEIEEKPGETCLICRTPIAAVKIVAKDGKIRRIEKLDTQPRKR